MSPVVLNPTIQNTNINPYLKSVNDFLISHGVDPNSAQGQAYQQQAASGGLSGGGGMMLPILLGKKLGTKYLFAKGAESALPTAAETAEGAGAMSTMPTTTLADVQSLSNGGAALQSTAPEAFQSLNTAAQGAEGGISTASGVADTTAGTGSTLASVTPYLGLAGAGLGAYGMYKGIGAGSRKATAMGGAALGGGLAAAAPLLGLGPVGAAGILAAALLGGGAGAMMGHIKTGKSMAQQARDDMRSNLQQTLGLDRKSFNLNGFDFGADGKHTFASTDGGTHRGYEVDMSNPLAVSTIPALRQFVMNMNPNAGDTEQKQTIGMLANAMLNNASSSDAVNKNIQNLFSQAHMSGVIPGLSGTGFNPNQNRSQTRSPGISKSGQRISYGK